MNEFAILYLTGLTGVGVVLVSSIYNGDWQFVPIAAALLVVGIGILLGASTDHSQVSR